MTYFSYKEIFFGLIAFVLIGGVVAVFKINMQILFQSKQSAICMIKRLYKNRNCLMHIKKDALRFSARKKEGFFIDFFTVLVLFFLYILVSYIYFDGLCRIVYLLITYIAYRIADAFLGNTVYSAALSVFHVFFIVIELFLSCLVFILYRTSRVIIRPILLIIGYARKSLIKITESEKRRSYLAAVKKDIDSSFGVLEIL